ncbi:MAG: FAD-dependent oxidoreductase, partial [Thermoplasmatota archaeon]
LERGILRRGGVVRHGARVARLADAGSHVACYLSSGASVRARSVVVAAGFHTPALFPDFAPRLAVTRQVELFFDAPRDLELPVFAAFEDGFYGFPRDAAGTVKVADHSKGPVVSDFERRPAATRAEIRDARGFFERRIPTLARAPLVGSRVCLYDNSPDDRFIIERPRGSRRATIACGFSGHGFKFGPATGARLASLALGVARPAGA